MRVESVEIELGSFGNSCCLCARITSLPRLIDIAHHSRLAKCTQIQRIPLVLFVSITDAPSTERPR